MPLYERDPAAVLAEIAQGRGSPRGSLSERTLDGRLSRGSPCVVGSRGDSGIVAHDDHSADGPVAAGIRLILPKRLQPRAKGQLYEIYKSETKEIAEEEIEKFVKEYEDKYPKAVASLLRGRERMLTLFDFPAAHWQSIRSTNVIESAFATVRLRQRVTKGAGSRAKGLSMAFKLLAMAEKRWRRIRSPQLVMPLLEGMKFLDGKPVEKDTQEGQKSAA